MSCHVIGQVKWLIHYAIQTSRHWLSSWVYTVDIGMHFHSILDLLGLFNKKMKIKQESCSDRIYCVNATRNQSSNDWIWMKRQLNYFLDPVQKYCIHTSISTASQGEHNRSWMNKFIHQINLVITAYTIWLNKSHCIYWFSPLIFFSKSPFSDYFNHAAKLCSKGELTLFN